MIGEVAADSKIASGLIELASMLIGRDVPVRKRSFVDQLLKRA